jgi:hypothetical protein
MSKKQSSTRTPGDGKPSSKPQPSLPQLAPRQIVQAALENLAGMVHALHDDGYDSEGANGWAMNLLGNLGQLIEELPHGFEPPEPEGDAEEVHHG